MKNKTIRKTISRMARIWHKIRIANEAGGAFIEQNKIIISDDIRNSIGF
jgi:hypothetical protein